jgi:predicted Rossmann fold flavoprotein
VPLRIDFARHSSHEQAHGLLRSWQQVHGKKLLRTMLSQHSPEITLKSTSPDQTSVESDSSGSERPTFGAPMRLAEVLLETEQIPLDQPCSTLTSGQIHRLVSRIKAWPFTVTGTRGFKEAMVTAGGVKLSEVDPRTMESKIVPGLFLAGEVLDLTGPSGGYNLQLAFSTGHQAGRMMGERLRGG